MIRPRISWFWPTEAKACDSSAIVWPEKAFFFSGRLIVSVAIWSWSIFHVIHISLPYLKGKMLIYSLSEWTTEKHPLAYALTVSSRQTTQHGLSIEIYAKNELLFQSQRYFSTDSNLNGKERFEPGAEVSEEPEETGWDADERVMCRHMRRPKRTVSKHARRWKRT